jgi:hypothetical protein
MPDWNRYTPSDFEYDFEKDKLFAHGIEFEEAVESNLKKPPLAT